jgi:hypothetical protein
MQEAFVKRILVLLVGYFQFLENLGDIIGGIGSAEVL